MAHVLWILVRKTRAVDELYNLCEDDMNMKRAKEATALLQRCTSDFEKVVPEVFAR